MAEMILKEHEVFSEWLDSQTDKKLIAAVTNRMDFAQMGNFGDHKSITDVRGVSEMRIHYGPGYRIYYTIREHEIVILLCAGDKSEQKRNIKQVKRLIKEF